MVGTQSREISPTRSHFFDRSSTKNEIDSGDRQWRISIRGLPFAPRAVGQ
jgi:hypothetical protein